MVTAIAEAGYPLHVWTRRAGSLDALGNVAHLRHYDSRNLPAACDIVALCVSTDEDVMQIVTGGLVDGLRRASVVVKHATGTPGNAVVLTNTRARAGVDVLDAPVWSASGSRGVDADSVTTRGLAGANGLPALLRRLNP